MEFNKGRETESLFGSLFLKDVEKASKEEELKLRKEYEDYCIKEKHAESFSEWKEKNV
mgnify:CR=1 FL=1|jgi:hypothetical protein